MRRRGQTLVVFALSLLLLVLMVTMTLSIGMKAKEKMELQTMADAAAYSNAVATARAFNSISLMNRALMGHMVALTGVESLISWSSYYRGAIQGARNAYDDPLTAYSLIAASSCPTTNVAMCRCATQAILDITQTQSDLENADKQLDTQWEPLDRAAGQEAASLQLSSIWEEQKDVYEALTRSVSSNPAIATSIVSEARRGLAFGGEDVSAKEVAINGRELEGGNGCGGNGAACLRRNAGRKLHFVDAAMGSRGYSFVTGRGVTAPIRRKLRRLIPNQDRLVSVSNSGSGYFPAQSISHSGPTIDATEVWGDDHGDVSIVFNRGQAPCPRSFPGTAGAEAHVRSNHRADTSDEHVWTNGHRDPDAQIRHTMGTCTQCPGIWPSHMDYNYNLVTDGGDNYGQPKNYAVIQRDYRQRPGEGQADPWNLMFRFRFSPKKEGVEFDNRGVELSDVNGGTDISKATALSAGIAYYRRAGPNWQEPPNFLNPFWRATLVSAHVDDQGIKDVRTTLNDTAPFAAEVYEALRKKEYKGW
ncbi:MAG TPA: pilus assembly protein TadG-related protein [Archangium sp.]|uniref:pilus assembly protein TadG-related protein n=1 Tax=Archangium sp. TaxID=1872627 RepID=UPI002E315EEE|nr:pilus assembly protein TadG-related protein [Archangium sp.]HEX5753172.1 pilus assembly protein TadG-related protein [Archangium sp.]